MRSLPPRGAQLLRASPVVVAVLVAGLLTTQSSATAGVEASAASAVIETSLPHAPIPVLVTVAALAEQATDRAVTPTGTKLAAISKETRYGLPTTAKAAYERAARRIERTRPGCDLPWGLLAGIGRVESDHGRYDGSKLGVDGVSRPPIVGIALNGVGPVAAIRDSDNGKLDGDKVWDRAVGPMQFIPTTWATAGVDGDGDGVADPNDLDDAALAAAGYLCPLAGSIGDETGMRRAVFTYNHSDYYVDLVLAFAVGYHTGVFDIPAPPVEPDPEVEDVLVDAKPGKGTEAVVAAPAKPPKTSAPSKQPTATEPPKSEPTKPPKPEPTKPPAPAEPALVLKSGTGPWSACGGGWCVSGYALDLGPATQVAAPAAGDFDGDGLVETNALEFDGLVGRTVTFQVERGTAVLYTIEGFGYRNADGSFTRPTAG